MVDRYRTAIDFKEKWWALSLHYLTCLTDRGSLELMGVVHGPYFRLSGIVARAYNHNMSARCSFK